MARQAAVMAQGLIQITLLEQAGAGRLVYMCKGSLDTRIPGIY